LAGDLFRTIRKSFPHPSPCERLRPNGEATRTPKGLPGKRTCRQGRAQAKYTDTRLTLSIPGRVDPPRTHRIVGRCGPVTQVTGFRGHLVCHFSPPVPSWPVFLPRIRARSRLDAAMARNPRGIWCGALPVSFRRDDPEGSEGVPAGEARDVGASLTPFAQPQRRAPCCVSSASGHSGDATPHELLLPSVFPELPVSHSHAIPMPAVTTSWTKSNPPLTVPGCQIGM
jgi:hypothetical protein